jgi:hypothetical protein
MISSQKSTTKNNTVIEVAFYKKVKDANFLNNRSLKKFYDNCFLSVNCKNKHQREQLMDFLFKSPNELDVTVGFIADSFYIDNIHMNAVGAFEKTIIAIEKKILLSTHLANEIKSSKINFDNPNLTFEKVYNFDEGSIIVLSEREYYIVQFCF